MPIAPLPQPQSYEFYGQPWAAREERFRPQPGSPSPIAVPPQMRGQYAGTPAYEAGLAPPGGSLPLPPPYDWDGKSPVPNELYAMAVDLASAFADAGPPIPPQSDVSKFEGWLLFVYQALIAKGEGCGLDPNDVERVMIRHAGEGPHAVAYYLQEAAMASDVCAKFLFKRPLDPPTPPAAPPGRSMSAPPVPEPTSHEIPATGTFVTKSPPKTTQKPFPWGWTIGGVSAAVAVAVGVYFLYKSNKPKRRKNPCSCGNPSLALAIEADELPEEENPYAGSRAYTSIDRDVLGQTLQPVLRNPSKKRKARRRARR